MPTAPTPVPTVPTTIAQSVGAGGGGGGNGGGSIWYQLQQSQWAQIGGGWWIVLHLFFVVGLIAAVVMAVFARDPKRRMWAFRGIFGFPLALFLIHAALFVCNFALAVQEWNHHA